MITKRPSVAAEGLKEALASKQNADGKIEIDGLVEVSVLALFFIQRLGKPTLNQIIEKLDGISAVVNPHLLEQAVEALRARGLCSYAQGKLKDGQRIKMWKVRNSIWAKPPEVAHIIDLLPALVATDEAQTIIETMNKGEEEGDGESKSTRKLGYDEYVDVKATFITIDELVGSQPTSPWLDELVKGSPHNGVEADIRFWRREEDGAIMLGSDAVAGWLRTGLRTEGYPEAAAQYIAVDPIIIHPKKPLKQMSFPVIDQRTREGKGVNNHEGLKPRETFDLHFRFPTRGFMSPTQFRDWLAGYGPRPVRGLSPARGRRFGRVALIGFEVVGDLKNAADMINSVMDVIPQEAREFYQQIALEAKETGLQLRKGKSAEA